MVYGTRAKIQDRVLRQRLGIMEHGDRQEGNELPEPLPRSRIALQPYGMELESRKVQKKLIV